jgi:hypothetical protein
MLWPWQSISFTVYQVRQRYQSLHCGLSAQVFKSLGVSLLDALLPRQSCLQHALPPIISGLSPCQELSGAAENHSKPKAEPAGCHNRLTPIAGSCNGSPGTEWAESGCASMRVGSKCPAPCTSNQQGAGYVAECTMIGWQVTARDCANVTTPSNELNETRPVTPEFCPSLPTANAPAGSNGWETGCAGRADGQICQATCDGNNSYVGPGYTARCQAGQWTVQPSGSCEGELPCRALRTNSKFKRRAHS